MAETARAVRSSKAARHAALEALDAQGIVTFELQKARRHVVTVIQLAGAPCPC